MQNYLEISPSTPMLESLKMLQENDRSVLSCNSGAAFPTKNLQPGMLCFRTDLNALYQLQENLLKWTQIADLSSDISKELTLRAPLESPALIGEPTAPTADAATNNTQIATTAYVTKAVSKAVSDMLGGAPTQALDTLKELGDALGNDANFATTVTNELAKKFDKAGGAIAGEVTINGTVAIAGSAGESVALEIGNLDGVASAPYIDFHSGAASADYDARIVASGGTSVSGKGELEFIASSFKFNGGSITGELEGNASTAAKLKTAYTINGVPFDGSSDIVISWVGTELTSDAIDLNDIRSEGAYYCPANVTAATFLNCPTKSAFSLRVWKAAGVIQELTEYTADDRRKTFQRAYYSSKWSAWAHVLTSNNAPVTSLVTSTTATGTTNTATTNTNTFLNVVDTVPGAGAAATGSSTQITGAGTVSVATDAAGKLTITGSQTITGNAGSASKLKTARTINGVEFDGSANIEVDPINRSTVDLDKTYTPTFFAGAFRDSSAGGSGGISADGLPWAGFDGAGIILGYGSDSTQILTNAGALKIRGSDANPITGSANFGAWRDVAFTDSDITGSAASANKLVTARTINGTSFDGTGNITTSNWGTARTITIGSKGKSVNGSENVSWSLEEIGAAAADHSHSYLPLSGGTMTGRLTLPTFGSSWIGGTSGASASISLPPSSASSWHAWIAQKTAGGNAFAVGQLGETWSVSWASAANIAAGNNVTTQVLSVNSGGVAINGNATASTITCPNWLRTTGQTGWYSETYGGGLMMQDTTWVRIHNGKSFYCPGEGAFVGNVTAYYSDKRLKTKLKPIKGALDTLGKLTGYHYHANKLGAKYGYDPEKAEVGLLAQDVQAVIPEVVEQAPFDRTGVKGESKTGKNYLTLKYDRLVPHLVEAIKELTEIAKKQSEEIKAMKKQLSAIY